MKVQKTQADKAVDPLIAVGWLVFTILLLVAPAAIWAAWGWLL